MAANLTAIQARADLFEPVGSRVTCDPPPTNTDEDYLILVAANRFAALEVEVVGQGFALGGSRVGDEFRSYKLEAVNLIVTTKAEFFDRFMAATSVAQRFNLLDKADRIALFQAVLYGARAAMREAPPASRCGYMVDDLWASIRSACGR